MQVVDLEEIGAIARQLPEQWRKYIKRDRAPFLRSMGRIQGLLGIPSGEFADDSWNAAIQWLDRNYPDWRGYPAPSRVRKAALREES